ncbi:transcriptional regulator [Bacillus thuringiensis]|uniref:transcriptional regulator n=1 Tax=Bacillus thuringiensis TaxID=1428 RepID=UPI0005AF4159|nr:transcriptional regulator [Bacillus thuringiensis]KIP24240.1 hypothetical protein BG10_6726 [Bacillus thuringiensis serovar morrisoni]MCT6948293.1 transcriptional regulator [Bacillus thuringiensis]MED2080184.1 transcriptional regulator [Bacillus thuringiensis]MEE2015550.1 transcriptional regulator [Bacillus thuringiensis]NUW49284.1 transcriptional regulator [Bacillus thuringiensis]
MVVHSNTAKEFIVYKGETFICAGTAKECAEYMGVKPETVKFYARPAYKKRVAARKNARNYMIVEEWKMINC